MNLDRRRFVTAGTSALFMGQGLLASSAGNAATVARRLVKTVEGTLRGYETAKLAIFKGVAYGEDTTHRRFQAPVSVKPWNGVRDAFACGSPCYQNNPDPPAWQDAQPESEDCLKLNIWAPKDARNAPVMVWIHGGGYWWGSGGLPAYDGSALAERGGVIVVTVNHRLNVFGYLNLGALVPEYEGVGNPGHRDLVEALRWIRRNIAAFGGDADQVTVFGESGGGGKVTALLSTPCAKGLFQRAIVQSCSAPRFRTNDMARKEVHDLCVLAGIDPDNPSALADVPAARLRAAYAEFFKGDVLKGDIGLLPMAPVQDGNLLPYQPRDPRAMALWADVPLLVGTTRDEAVWLMSVNGALPNPSNDEELLAELAPMHDLGRLRLKALVQALRDQMPGADLQHLMVAAGTAIWMGANAVRQADMKAALGAAPVYYYRFDWEEPIAGKFWAFHGADVGFVFGTQDLPTIIEAKSDAVAERSKRYRSEQWHAVRDVMMDSWIAFAKTGNPGNPTVPDWGPYSLTSRSFMRFDTRPLVDEGPLPAEVIALLYDA